MALIIDPLDTTYLKSVRGLLGGVDDISLPDDDINDPTILDVAEIEVINLLPEYSLFTEPADMARIRLAVIHIMASLLCPSMPARVDIEVKAIDSSWKRKAVDYDALAERLYATAVSLLTPLGAVEDGVKFDIFKIAPSKATVMRKWERDRHG